MPFDRWSEDDTRWHLLRLWLAILGSQPLPGDWVEYFGDVRGNAGRGELGRALRTGEFTE